MGDAARVAFRTDAGSAVGLGHLSRCLALAHALRTLGAESRVLIDGDHRALGLALAVFDDTANRELPVDLVINGGAGARALPYRGGPRTRYLLGPSYLALRPEFAEAAPRAIHDDVRRALRAAVGAVAGRVVLHESPKHLRDLMLVADLAVIGGGQTVYELAATGTPMVAIGLAANQTPNVDAMRAAGALAYAGDVNDAALGPGLVATLAALAADPGRRADMSRRGRALVDGRGAPRVARALLDLIGR